MNIMGIEISRNCNKWILISTLQFQDVIGDVIKTSVGRQIGHGWGHVNADGDEFTLKFWYCPHSKDNFENIAWQINLLDRNMGLK